MPTRFPTVTSHPVVVVQVPTFAVIYAMQSNRRAAFVGKVPSENWSPAINVSRSTKNCVDPPVSSPVFVPSGAVTKSAAGFGTPPI